MRSLQYKSQMIKCSMTVLVIFKLKLIKNQPMGSIIFSDCSKDILLVSTGVNL